MYQVTGTRPVGPETENLINSHSSKESIEHISFLGQIWQGIKFGPGVENREHIRMKLERKGKFF